MHNSIRRLLAAILLFAFSFHHSLALAQPLDPPDLALVDAGTASARLTAHQLAIEERLQAMTGAWDTQVTATLKEAFSRRGVDELAFGYAEAWAGNSLYLTWVNSVRSFYMTHTEALRVSRLAIEREGFATEDDLAYIDRGMAAWLAEEPSVPGQMQAYADGLAEYAFHLGNRMKITSDNRLYFSDTPAEERARLQAEADLHRSLADQVSTAAVEADLVASGMRQLFSAIDGISAIAAPMAVAAPTVITISERDDRLCDELQEQRKGLVQSVDRLLAQKLPQEQFAETAILIRQLREVITGTQADAGAVATRIEQISKAAEKLDGGIAGTLARIASGVKDNTSRLKEATDVLDLVASELEHWAALMETMETASAQQQLLALKDEFDRRRGQLPPANIPGLKQLLDAQSGMIERIAGSAGAMEARARDFDEIGREVIGKPIYMRTKGPREVLADARAAAIEALEKLDSQIKEHGCNGITAEEQSLCEEAHPRVTAAIEQAMQANQGLQSVTEAYRQVEGFARRRADRVSADRAIVVVELADLNAKLANPINKPPRDVEAWRAARTRTAARLAELELALNSEVNQVSDSRLMVERATQQWRDAVEAKLGETGWDFGEWLWMRNCTDGRWRLARPT